MKKIIFIGIILTSSCMQMEYDMLYSTAHVKPSMSPDGVRTFRISVFSKLPSYIKNTTLEDFHKSQISDEMGRLNYCTNGYTVDYTNPTKIENVIFYNGRCK